MITDSSHSVARIAIVLLVTSAVAAHAQTITVTTLHDITDFAAPHRVENLPGPDGRVSFQEACQAANNTPGPQTIEFAIPQSEFWLITNLALIELDAALFLLSDDATTIDFSSQTRNIGDTNPNGPEVGIYGLQPNGWGSPAIIITASNCVIRGLGPVMQRGASVAIWQGSGNRVVGCATGTIEIDGSFGGPVTHSNIIGGTTPEDANDLSVVGILCWSDNNVVIGNRLRHVRVEGSQYCVFPTGNRIGGPTPAERNVIAGWGSYGEEGFPNGSMVDVTWAQDTLIEGNYIGTTPDGMSRQAQIGTAGVAVVDSLRTTIRGNLIAGLRTAGANHYAGQVFGQAIFIGATNRDNESVVVEGNTIGLAADGLTPIPTANGIVVSPMTSRQHVRGVQIGGLLPGQGNEIAAVERLGVVVATLENGVTVSGNSIHDCGGLGIDLVPGGPTLNDPLDADTNGGNRLQNFPTIAEATVTGATAQIVGMLSSAPMRSYHIEFFASPSCDASGYGEGQNFLGATELSTDGAGGAAFDVALPTSAIPGWVVTATATDIVAGDTSEFSACVAIASGSIPTGDIDGDGDVDLQDLATFLASFGSCSGDPGFNAAADFDSSGCIELGDLAALLTNFGA